MTADWRHLVGSLPRGVQGEKTPPALLLTGREGSGKRVLLRRLAAQLACSDQAACGQCLPCRNIMAGRHPDVWAVEPEDGTIRRSAIDTLSQHLTFRGQAGYRIGLIADAEQMTAAAANGLLKILEEPPAGAYLWMSASGWRRVLPTLRSRAVHLPLPPPPVAEVEAWLRREGRDVPRGEAFALWYAGIGGSPGAALAACDGEEAKGREQIAVLIAQGGRDAAVAGAAQKLKELGVTSQELGREGELALNRYYREQWRSGQRPRLGAVAARRAVLRRLKASGARLNIPLAAEQLGGMSGRG